MWESFDDMGDCPANRCGDTSVGPGRGSTLRSWNIDSSNFAVTGHVTAMEYTDEAGDKRAGGLLGKLFK